MPRISLEGCSPELATIVASGWGYGDWSWIKRSEEAEVLFLYLKKRKNSKTK